jgi:hypothetical protein
MDQTTSGPETEPENHEGNEGGSSRHHDLAHRFLELSSYTQDTDNFQLASKEELADLDFMDHFLEDGIGGPTRVDTVVGRSVVGDVKQGCVTNMGREALINATCTFLTQSEHKGLELFLGRRERTNGSSPSAHPHFHRGSHPVIW